MSRIRAAALACALLACPAASQAQVLAPQWDGWYAGGNLGLAFGETRDKGMRSLHAGRDWAMGEMTLGAELEWSETEILVPGGEMSDLARLKLRVGHEAGNVLYYGVAGLAYANGSFGDDLGWMVGLGVDVRVYGRFSVGAEMAHHAFPDFSGGGGALGINTITARVTYHF